jgi:hypothetical protein
MKKRGRPPKHTKNINILQQGDKVTCMTHDGEWTLVYYIQGDATCAIQNETHRCIVKTSIIKKVIEEQET